MRQRTQARHKMLDEMLTRCAPEITLLFYSHATFAHSNEEFEVRVRPRVARSAMLPHTTNAAEEPARLLCAGAGG